MTRLSPQIKDAARKAGFDAVGISRVDDPPVHETLRARLMDWLARSFEAGMSWMAKDPERRADPHRVLPGCRSIISVGINYYTAERADERPGHGRIARYAWGRDYHELFGERLEALRQRLTALAPDHTFRWYVDTGPVMEKAWAQQAGIGWIGKHSNLVSARHGSWLLLGEILTTLDLDPDEPAADLCGTCTLCLRACPTGAIAEPYVVDAARCISYLTIELRGDGHRIPDELAARMGNRIFGCDDCLDVCPYNTQATPTDEPAFQPTSLTLAPRLADLEQMNEPEFSATFRHSAIRRPKLAGFLRNVRIARKNQQPVAG